MSVAAATTTITTLILKIESSVLLDQYFGHQFQTDSISEPVNDIYHKEFFSIISTCSDKTLSDNVYSLTREREPGCLV